MERPKRTQKAAETYGFRSSLYSSRVFSGPSPSLAFGLATWLRLPTATAVFILTRGGAEAPSSLKAYIGIKFVARQYVVIINFIRHIGISQ